MYLELKENLLDKIEILLGPKISDADKLIVKLLCKEFASHATIKESLLTGKIL